MTSTHLETAPVTNPAPHLRKFEKLPNHYRLIPPGDQPNKPTGFYYALIEHGRKQFRSPVQFLARRLSRELSERTRLAPVALPV